MNKVKLRFTKIAMAYICELNPGHHVYLDNQGNQTIVVVTTVTSSATTAMGQAGQQQSSSTLSTGSWTAPPQAYKTSGGAIFKLLTTQGSVCVCVQGSSVNITGDVSSVVGAQSLSMQQTAAPGPSMSPMQPMQPMQPMGNMQMTMNPMEMRMGTMELKMESVSQPAEATTQKAATPQATTSGAATSGPTAVRQFCSQCGTKVAPEDRFCSSCGHALS